MNNTSIHLFDNYSLDLARGCLTREQVPVHLRRQSYEVLRYLVQNRGNLISKDRLIEEVWQGRAVTDGSLGKCIEELREALGPTAKEYIRNVRGRGYIFDVEVQPHATVGSLSNSEQPEDVQIRVEQHAEESAAAQNLVPMQSYEFGAFRLIPSEHQFLREDTPVPLPPKAFETLVLLVEQSGHLIEKQDLMQLLWPDSFVEEANLTHHIWTLRKALGESDDGPQYIQTVPRRGYRFVADVRQSIVSAAQTVSEQQEVFASSPANTGIIAGSSPSSVRRHVLLLLALAVAAVVCLGYFTVNRKRPARLASSVPISLLVLPFENQSGNPEEKYFSDGMTEEMITELASIQPAHLRVIARSSAVQLKSSGKDINQMARELGVDYVLESSVFRANDRVRINARLIKVSDQSHLWAHSYERELRDVLALQNEVASSISQEIALQLNTTDQIQPGSVRQVNPAAHEAYLKGLYFFDKISEAGMKTSIEYFQQAIEEDSGYAPAYARMARAYGVLGNLNSLRPDEAYPKEKQAALKAIELDDRLAEAHTALGWAKLFYDRDWSGAREEFARAVNLSPNSAIAHQGYAMYFVSMGEFDRVETEILKAQQLDPVNLNIKADVGWFLFFARRTDESIAQLKQVLTMDPEFATAHVFLALAYQEKGMFPEAISEAKKSLELFDPNENRLAILGDAYARAGQRPKARGILARLQTVSQDRYVSPYTIGLIYASLGQTNEALDWLEKSSNDRFWMMAFLKVDPRWDSLRSHPRFIDLMRRTGLTSQD